MNKLRLISRAILSRCSSASQPKFLNLAPPSSLSILWIISDLHRWSRRTCLWSFCVVKFGLPLHNCYRIPLFVSLSSWLGRHSPSSWGFVRSSRWGDLQKSAPRFEVEDWVAVTSPCSRSCSSLPHLCPSSWCVVADASHRCAPFLALPPKSPPPREGPGVSPSGERSARSSVPSSSSRFPSYGIEEGRGGSAAPQADGREGIEGGNLLLRQPSVLQPMTSTARSELHV